MVKSKIHYYLGASFTGDPTAYIIFDQKIVWVIPGNLLEAQWVEV